MDQAHWVVTLAASAIALGVGVWLVWRPSATAILASTLAGLGWVALEEEASRGPLLGRHPQGKLERTGEVPDRLQHLPQGMPLIDAAGFWRDPLCDEYGSTLSPDSISI